MREELCLRVNDAPRHSVQGVIQHWPPHPRHPNVVEVEQFDNCLDVSLRRLISLGSPTEAPMTGCLWTEGPPSSSMIDACVAGSQTCAAVSSTAVFRITFEGWVHGNNRRRRDPTRI